MKTPQFTLPLLAAAMALAACGGGSGGSPETSVAVAAGSVYQVGTTSFDADLPAEPTLPADTQVCATLEASNTYVRRPDGALPPEADPSKSGVGVAVTVATANPDQARIQAALDSCGAAVDAEVGAKIAAADATATAAQKT
ncbi:MAG: endopolygalacturonase, partial [Pseudomonadota bacterium]|nr:endopolygalacturonase [Pseudomonadota bacterium]